jgi:hypothetical protein
MKIKQKKIFLSHSSKDKALADRLTELLTTGCDVSPNDILYTSEPGMGIPAGYHSFIEYLHGQIQNPALVILLLSENYFASHFCVCELGATWGGNLPSFPLVVPPTDRARLKATLLVTQAGYVNTPECLHELRDRIKDELKKSVPTALWDAKCKAFLNEIDGIIKALPAPASVPAEKLLAIKNEYDQAVEVIAKQAAQEKILKAQIDELEKIKPKETVKVVTAKFSTGSQQFDRYQQHAQTALKRLHLATRTALYWSSRGEPYFPKSDDEWNVVETARAENEVDIKEGEKTSVIANDGHPRVEAANDALLNLQEFFDDDKNYYFIHELTDNYRFPIKLTNKEFWRNFLANV